MSDQPQPMTEEEHELAQVKRQAEEHLEGWKRAKADYLNLKRQSEKEREDIAKFAQAAVVMEFLPLYDNLKRAAAHIPDDQKTVDWVQGILHIQSQFLQILKTIGLEPIPTVGQPFDHHLHHAISNVKAKGVASGTIVAELKGGWKLGDRVLAPAQVSVAE